MLIQIVATTLALAAGHARGADLLLRAADAAIQPALRDSAVGALVSGDAQANGEKPKKAKKAKKKKADADAVAPDDIADPDAPPDTVSSSRRFVWKQHPSLRYGNAFRMDFAAKFQEDAHGSYPDAKGLYCPNNALPTTCLWQLHRNRIGVEGYFFKHIEYTVERELTEQELTEKDVLAGYTPKPLWKDVNVNLSYFKAAQLRAGKFNIPFGLDTTTGDTHNDYAYRSLGSNYLTPARDTGVELHGRLFKKSMNYWAGVFEHDGDNARSKKIQGGNETVAARVAGNPLKKLGGFDTLTFGTAYAYTKVSDDNNIPNGLRGRTILTQDTIFDAVYVKGHRQRWEGDVDFTKGSGSLRAEYMVDLDQRLQQGLSGQDLPDARGQAWYVSGTWVLTGEPKTRPVKPANEFLRGGLGSIEVATRFERLWFDSTGSGSALALRNPRAETILGSGEKALTIGVNWTLNRWVKMQFNAIRETIEDSERSPVAAGAFWSRVARFQFLL